MLECLIMGDSIAVGTDMFAPRECVSYSVSGINSKQWNRRWGRVLLEAETVVISLGTNDHEGVNTYRQLSNIRYRIRSMNVVWIMPPCNERFCKPDVNATVRNIANLYGDRIISTRFLSPDRIHPTSRGYRDLVNKADL